MQFPAEFQMKLATFLDCVPTSNYFVEHDFALRRFLVIGTVIEVFDKQQAKSSLKIREHVNLKGLTEK